MPKYKMVIMSKPVEGREDEYNDWYQNVHLKDIVAVDGFKSAQRFRMSVPVTPGSLPYLAIYELETDDVNAAVAELGKRSASGRMVVSTALSNETLGAVYEEMGPVVKR